MDNTEIFRHIEEIPLPYRNVFNEYPCFNAVQSQVLDAILYNDYSVVISSPTGSGKTAVFELAIVRLLMQCESLDISSNIKIVYISPIKSLCQERLVDWHKKFSPFGLNCASITGDSDNVDFQQLINHNVIISTPEKWDSLTRRWRDNEQIVKVVKLFLIDEVHLLNEENRGSILEVIVSRMNTVEKTVVVRNDGGIYNQKIRFIALSATVPNVEDIAEWLSKAPDVKYYQFSEEMRPVKLRKIVLGYNYNPKTTSPFKFDLSLNYKLQSLIMQYSEGKPTLIFCSTRKSVEMTANHIVQTLRIHLSAEQTQKLLSVADLITDSKAKFTIKHGIGYHHAGMIPENRHAIENLFRRGDLPVLVTTSTLAMGVNLPAHLVIIKSTKCYDNCGFRDYTETAIHQMIGRAGRPQFDTSATALILTTSEDKLKFEKMVGRGQPIESNLHRHLIEHLNAEVVLRTITDLDVAMQWLASTFLYVRARKNPRHYGLNMGLSKDQIDKKLLEICQIDLNKLVKAGMLTMDQDIIITPTITGQIMAKFYIAFETMKLFTQISGTEVLIQILDLIARCQEFSEMRLRVNDKKTLNLLNKNSNKNTIRFPLNGKIKTGNMKVNCIIQAILGNLEISDHAILSESFKIMRNGERVAKCLIEYLETRKTNCYSALLNTIILCKCFQAKLWENSPYVSKQLSGIGSVMSHQLANAGKTTFRKILDANPRDLEMVIKRKHPMGNTLIEEVQHLPFYEMTLENVNSAAQLKICVRLANADDLRDKSTVNVNATMTLIVGNNFNEILIYEKYRYLETYFLHPRHAYMIENGMIVKFVDLNQEYTEVAAHFISNDWVGVDCNATVAFVTDDQQSTVNKSVDKKDDEKKNPTYIQMFLDMYMKTKKSTKQDKLKPGDQKEKKGQDHDVYMKNKSNKSSNGCKKGKWKRNEDQIVDKDEVNVANDDTPDAGTEAKMLAGDVGLESSPLVEENRPDEPPGEDPFPIENLTKDITDFASEIVDGDHAKDDVSNTSSTSLFSNGLSAAIFAEHVQKMEDEIMKEMQIVGVGDGIGEAPIMDELERGHESIAHEMEIDGKINNRDKSIIDFDEKLSKTPSTFLVSQKYVTDEYVVDSGNVDEKSKNKQKKRKGDFHITLTFEGSKDETRKRQKLAQFKFPVKRKFVHRPDLETLPDSTQDQQHYAIAEILEPAKVRKSAFEKGELVKNADVEYKEERNNENVPKSITWRSPLVFSPAVKFSPKLSFQNGSFKEEIEGSGSHNDRTNETFETTSSKGTGNLTINIQRTPKRGMRTNEGKIRGTGFPLRDKDYEEEDDDNKMQNPNAGDDPLDICSASLLEELGLPRASQTRKRDKPTGTSPAANYYSQLISHPVHSQKEGGDTSAGKAWQEDKFTQKTPSKVRGSEGNAWQSWRLPEMNVAASSPARQFSNLPTPQLSCMGEFFVPYNRSLTPADEAFRYALNIGMSDPGAGQNLNASFYRSVTPQANDSDEAVANSLPPDYQDDAKLPENNPKNLDQTDPSDNCICLRCNRIVRHAFENPCYCQEEFQRQISESSYNACQVGNKPFASHYFQGYNYPSQGHYYSQDTPNAQYGYQGSYEYAPNYAIPHQQYFPERKRAAPSFTLTAPQFYRPNDHIRPATYAQTNPDQAPPHPDDERKAASQSRLYECEAELGAKRASGEGRLELMQRREGDEIYTSLLGNNIVIPWRPNHVQQWDIPVDMNRTQQSQSFYGAPYPQDLFPRHSHNVQESSSRSDKDYVMNKFLYSLNKD